MDQDQSRVLLECEFKFYMVTKRAETRARIERLLAARGFSASSFHLEDLSDSDLRSLNAALRSIFRT